MCAFVTFDLLLSDLGKFLSTKINAALPPLIGPLFLPLSAFPHFSPKHFSSRCQPLFSPLSIPIFYFLSTFTSFPFSPCSLPLSRVSSLLPLPFPAFLLSPLPLPSSPHHPQPIRCDTLTRWPPAHLFLLSPLLHRLNSVGGWAEERETWIDRGGVYVWGFGTWGWHLNERQMH